MSIFPETIRKSNKEPKLPPFSVEKILTILPVSYLWLRNAKLYFPQSNIVFTIGIHFICFFFQFYQNLTGFNIIILSLINMTKLFGFGHNNST